MQTVFWGSNLQLFLQKKNSCRQTGPYWVITTVHLSRKSCKPTAILKFHSSCLDGSTNCPKSFSGKSRKGFFFFSKSLNERRVSSHAKHLWMRISLAIKLLAAFNTEHVETLARGLPRARPQHLKLKFNSWGWVSNMETFLFLAGTEGFHLYTFFFWTRL